MLRFCYSIFSVMLMLYCVSASAQVPVAGVAQVLTSLDYLLSVDRLHFYSQNLADFLEGKKSPALIEQLRALKPEDFNRLQLSAEQLKDPAQWQQLLLKTLKTKDPQAVVTFGDLEWNYNFYKNKLVQAFKIDTVKMVAGGKVNPFTAEEEAPSVRSVPKIKGDKYLLDVERYVSEKTTRAIIWDAIQNDRDFEFHVGTQREFADTIARNGIQILGEVRPMARNYNKILLVFNPKTQRYAYAMNLISGNDRIVHLTAQLRLIQYEGRGLLDDQKDKVRVFGKVSEFHQFQEQELLKTYNRLPVADQVVIGQKGAIDTAIINAGMLKLISADVKTAVDALGITGSKLTKFEKLAENSTKSSAFHLEAMNASAVKIDKAYTELRDPIARIYRQFNSEQPSHEFTDYLLLDKTGQVKRWRVISAVWGDEIIPIAGALRKSGHKNVVYIGTAGAIAGKGYKVGDVLAGNFVQTHSGKTLPFDAGVLEITANQAPVTVGQVHTPFDETDRWFKQKASAMDIVEVETGYLREHLGEDIKLEAYFLISDVVGSEHETLAHAAQSSSKRKRGQQRLLENLFVKNGIVAPISNFEPIPNSPIFATTLNRLQKLRPSREILSLFQVAQVAVREGAKSDAQLEALLTAQPSFNRQTWDVSINNLGTLLAAIQRVLPSGTEVGVVSENLFNGTFNPARPTEIVLTTSANVSEAQLVQLIGNNRWQALLASTRPAFKIQFGEAAKIAKSSIRYFHATDASTLGKKIEDAAYNKFGYIRELDSAGRFRIKEIPGLQGGLRCEVLFLR